MAACLANHTNRLACTARRAVADYFWSTWDRALVVHARDMPSSCIYSPAAQGHCTAPRHKAAHDRLYASVRGALRCYTSSIHGARRPNVPSVPSVPSQVPRHHRCRPLGQYHVRPHVAQTQVHDPSPYIADDQIALYKMILCLVTRNALFQPWYLAPARHR